MGESAPRPTPNAEFCLIVYVPYNRDLYRHWTDADRFESQTHQCDDSQIRRSILKT